MRRTEKERAVMNRRKRLWEIKGWIKRLGSKKTARSGYFRKNHSLNCNCFMCEWDSYQQKRSNRTQRHNKKREINKRLAEE